MTGDLAPLIDAGDLARLLDVHPEWVRAGCRSGQLPFHRYGRRIRFTADDVAAIIAAGAQPVRTADPAPAVVLPLARPARAARRRYRTYPAGVG